MSRPRFNPTDFEDYARDLSPEVAAAGVSFALRPDAQPPGGKFQELVASDEKFAATWRGERKEFPSESEYELSLATIAVAHGWSDQEIADLIVAHRRLHKHDLLLNRISRVAVTIAKARRGFEEERAHAALSTQTGANSDVGGGKLAPGQVLKNVAKALGLGILRIVRYLDDPPEYRLLLEDGEISLGEVKNILNPTAFRASVAAASGTLIRRYKNKEWDPIAQGILLACEDEGLGVESTVAARVTNWLRDYFEAAPPFTSRDDAIPHKAPFLWDGTAAFFLESFRQWLDVYRCEKFKSTKALGKVVRAGGCKPLVVKWTTREGNETTRAAWLVPEGFTEWPVRERRTPGPQNTTKDAK